VPLLPYTPPIVRSTATVDYCPNRGVEVVEVGRI
jgi:hypothetical protein